MVFILIKVKRKCYQKNNNNKLFSILIKLLEICIKWNSQHNKINFVFCFSRFICTSNLVPIITYWSVSTSLFKITTLQQSWTPYSIWINQYLWIEKYGTIYPSFPFINKQQVWTQKCAVQKASVDVNISYY